MKDQDKEIVLRMNCMILACLTLGIILLYLWFRSRNVKLEGHREEQKRNGEKRRIIYVVQTICLLFLFRFGMQLQVNGAWIVDEYEYGRIDWFSTADNLFIFLFPILFSAADLFLTLRKKEWEGGSVRICFLLLNWAALLLGAASALNIYLAMQAFVAG